MNGKSTLAPVSGSAGLPEVLAAGPEAILVRFALRAEPAAMAAAQALAARLTTAPPAGVREIVPALVSVQIGFDSAVSDRATLAQELLARARAIVSVPAVLPEPARRWIIPAAFGGQDGPQLEETAALAGLSARAAVEAICDADLRILAIGFAPGQPYIGLLPEEWDLPRMQALNPAVPAGAVVVAVRQIVMFGAQSATGWRQVARAAFRSFVPGRESPMPLRAGDAIRYATAPADEIARLAETPDGLGGARLEILR
jgi:KipI family sensor histidine kinase inhibitor